ncbi:hypothetical protein APHAL10511_005040, partial [Amanita phalloides]
LDASSSWSLMQEGGNDSKSQGCVHAYIQEVKVKPSDPKKNQILDHDDGLKEHVSIPPVPGAPKKAQAYVMSSNANKSTGKKHEEAHISDDPSAMESESDSSFFTTANEANESPDNEVRCNPTTTEKSFANEQPFWHGACELRGKGPTSLIIHGQVIEISDDEAPITSPTTHLAPASVHDRIASSVNITVKKEMNDDIIHATLLPSPSLPLLLPMLLLTRPSMPSPQLLGQSILIFLKSMGLIEEHIHFEDAFPEFTLHTKWNHHVLIQACQMIGNMSFGTVKDKYAIFGQHMRVDAEYVGKISALLDPRISVLCGVTKSIASSNTHAFYSLEDGCMPHVQTLLAGNYIFLRTNGEHGHYLYNKPFEHPAIIATLCDDLFSSTYPITRKYSYRFLPRKEDEYMLEPSMVALAATAVYASLKEWETGTWPLTSFGSHM